LSALLRHAERLIVLIGSDKKVRIAFLASEIGGAGIWADQDNAGVGYRLEDRLKNIGKDRSDDEVDLVALNQSLCLEHSDVGFEFIVLHDHFDLAAAKLAAEISYRQLNAVAQLLTKHGGGARQRRDNSHPKVLLRPGLVRHAKQSHPRT